MRVGHMLILSRYVHQYDEELDEQKKARRPGRPASAREDLLKITISTLEKEQQNGFCKWRSSVQALR